MKKFTLADHLPRSLTHEDVCTSCGNKCLRVKKPLLLPLGLIALFFGFGGVLFIDEMNKNLGIEETTRRGYKIDLLTLGLEKQTKPVVSELLEWIFTMMASMGLIILVNLCLLKRNGSNRNQNYIEGKNKVEEKSEEEVQIICDPSPIDPVDASSASTPCRDCHMDQFQSQIYVFAFALGISVILMNEDLLMFLTEYKFYILTGNIVLILLSLAAIKIKFRSRRRKAEDNLMEEDSNRVDDSNKPIEPAAEEATV